MLCCYLQVDTFAQARDCLLPMGITSENVAQRYGVTRQEQDQAAVSAKLLLMYSILLVQKLSKAVLTFQFNVIGCISQARSSSSCIWKIQR